MLLLSLAFDATDSKNSARLIFMKFLMAGDGLFVVRLFTADITSKGFNIFVFTRHVIRIALSKVSLKIAILALEVFAHVSIKQTVATFLVTLPFMSINFEDCRLHPIVFGPYVMLDIVPEIGLVFTQTAIEANNSVVYTLLVIFQGPDIIGGEVTVATLKIFQFLLINFVFLF